MSETDSNGPINILLVENFSEHSSSVRQALDDGGVAGRLHRVGDLVEAIAYLREDTPYFATPRPDYVLIGQSQQNKCCCDLLAEVRRNPRFGSLRVIGLKDAWWQRVHKSKRSLPYACCDLRKVSVSELVKTINKLEADSLKHVLREYA